MPSGDTPTSARVSRRPPPPGRYCNRTSTFNSIIHAGREACGPLQSWRLSLQRMALGPGTRLGPYEIASAIGAGGIGRGLQGTRYTPGSHRCDQIDRVVWIAFPTRRRLIRSARILDSTLSSTGSARCRREI